VGGAGVGRGARAPALELLHLRADVRVVRLHVPARRLDRARLAAARPAGSRHGAAPAAEGRPAAAARAGPPSNLAAAFAHPNGTRTLSESTPLPTPLPTSGQAPHKRTLCSRKRSGWRFNGSGEVGAAAPPRGAPGPPSRWPAARRPPGAAAPRPPPRPPPPGGPGSRARTAAARARAATPPRPARAAAARRRPAPAALRARRKP